ncbi:Fur-regulated basic protein FbpA [Peribacillus saganii]|uniref:Fur-regulated basic protein FbpA n=1 Tax=Peribacillus saganii TaxID=2303992 RepID=A0A372LLP3_9BACI|nr:Fur-regulated basic protein FbpA [Peribacillus saganii]RFU67900.1 Fur-regulated basic protein FbpA [Peribacillus saganii]
MGRLVKLVIAKKEKIINALILNKIYKPEDRPNLLNLPLEELEKLFNQQTFLK